MAVLPPFTALGTRWQIELFDSEDATLHQAVHERVQSFLCTFDADYSRFKDDSLISTLNRERVLAHPPATLVELLQYGQQFYTDTNSVFNFLVGHHLVARGYDANYSFQPSAEPELFSNPLTDLTITPDKITLTTGAIDLGGFGKGYAIDQIAYLLQHEYAQREFLINGGGDIYATTEQHAPVVMYLEHPSIPQRLLASTTLLHQGFAASTPHKRAWTVGDTTYTHIVATTTPSTEQPDGIFVKAPSAMIADAYATALLIDPTLSQLLTSDTVGIASYSTATTTLTHSPAFGPLALLP